MPRGSVSLPSSAEGGSADNTSFATGVVASACCGPCQQLFVKREPRAELLHHQRPEFRFGATQFVEQQFSGGRVFALIARTSCITVATVASSATATTGSTVFAFGAVSRNRLASRLEFFDVTPLEAWRLAAANEQQRGDDDRQVQFVTG